MTLPTSLISLINIQTEFGGSIATSLNEYYRGGAYVPYYQPSTSYGLIPSSSTIGMGSFRGVTLATLKYVYILANTQNYVFNTAKVSGYVAGQGCVRLVIFPGVVVGSASAGSYALTVDTSWSSSDVVEIINQGYIVGAGGSGGNSAVVTNNTYAVAAQPGGSGGPAVLIQRATNFQNTGVIGGGGGGGGGGGYGAFISQSITTNYGGAGGSGGAGNNAGAGGSGEPPGAAGSLTAGGATTVPTWLSGGSGGAGGSLGVAGSAGGAGVPSAGGGSSAGGAGGAAGVAIVGQGNLTNNGSYMPGTVYGARS